MQEIAHPVFLKLYEVYEAATSIFVVVELVTGGELIQKIQRMGFFTEKEAVKLLKILLEALADLHGKGIMHRDLKPENILLKQPDSLFELRIADMGLATRADCGEFIYHRCGTPGYVAPEIFYSTEKYDPVCDIFSLGAIFYQM
jgi:serine/threonine protein kinase